MANTRISISRTLPATHPRAGEPTNFQQKILNTFYDMHCLQSRSVDVSWEALKTLGNYSNLDSTLGYKPHTIRGMYTASGKLAHKAGDKLDMFSWSGLPYRSSPITWARGVEIVRTVEVFILSWTDIRVGDKVYIGTDACTTIIQHLAANDGLTVPDFKAWFAPQLKKPKPMQILIWDDSDLPY
jgi:hypothetical protein